ncbi:hypothetical protein B9Z19DRAFT_1156178 [Tuber borchii]|uniref:Uncharacterized protein n=1 Tax=Tuber borchii TaxID=42251 RepID=A0A2T6ZHF2_TUBBO|nr:hypothetical protein B9Z19DRAFT_1156178 [Tuber borchii]
MFITLNRYKSSKNGNIQPIFSTLRFHSCYSHQVGLTHSFLPRIPFFHFSHYTPYKSPFNTSYTMWTDILPALLLLLSIAVQGQIPNPAPTGVPVGNTIVLLGYNKDGCPGDVTPASQISDTTSCNFINGIGISNVKVLPIPDMPPTCILTLYADTNCLSNSNAKIGPIAPAPAHFSACIGPIRDPSGAIFEAKGATLQC